MTYRTARHTAYLVPGLLVVLTFVILGFSGWLLYSWFTSHERAIVWDLFSPWLALRRMLLDGLNPYSPAVLQETQQAIYGRIAYPYEDQQAFSYPLSIMVVMGPLAVLPLPLAQTIWFLVIGVSFLAFLSVAPRAVGWSPPLWLRAWTLLCMCALYQNVWAFILGQVAIVVAAWVALAWWGLRYQHWTLAGVCIALATVKPQMSFLVGPGMLLWALWQRRIRVAVSFGITLVLLILLPTAWLLDWPLHWLERLHRYADYTFFAPPVQLLAGTTWLGWVVVGVLALWPMVMWWCARQKVSDNSTYAPADLWKAPVARDWLFSWLIVVTAMVAPRTSQANQLILFLPLFYFFSQLSSHRAQVVIAAIEAGIVVAIWLAAIVILPATHDPEYTLRQHQLISPILPLGITGILLGLSVGLRWRTIREAD
ncbi:MAG: glycosyltransferase family 87 protein [Anaerolineae bacterium]